MKDNVVEYIGEKYAKLFNEMYECYDFLKKVCCDHSNPCVYVENNEKSHYICPNCKLDSRNEMDARIFMKTNAGVAPACISKQTARSFIDKGINDLKESITFEYMYFYIMNFINNYENHLEEKRIELVREKLANIENIILEYKEFYKAILDCYTKLNQSSCSHSRSIVSIQKGRPIYLCPDCGLDSKKDSKSFNSGEAPTLYQKKDAKDLEKYIKIEIAKTPIEDIFAYIVSHTNKQKTLKK